MNVKESLGDYEKKIFDRFGYDVNKLNDEQIEIILQPQWAPENFYQDGEIDSNMADKIWLKKLITLGVYNRNYVEYILG